MYPRCGVVFRPFGWAENGRYDARCVGDVKCKWETHTVTVTVVTVLSNPSPVQRSFIGCGFVLYCGRPPRAKLFKTPTRLRRSSHRSPDDIERPSSERFCHMLTQSPGQSPGGTLGQPYPVENFPGTLVPLRTRRWAAFTRVKKKGKSNAFP